MPAPQPDERAAAAAARQRHAEAEHQSADDAAEPAEAGGEIDRLAQIDQAGGMQGLAAGDRHGHGEQPRPHPVVILEEQDVGQRAHRAEIRALRDRAERDAGGEGPEGDKLMDGEVGHRANVALARIARQPVRFPAILQGFPR